MEVKLLFFGQLTDISGSSELQLKAGSLNECMAQLANLCPALEKQGFQLALNKKTIDRQQDVLFKDGDVLAFMPPFSGG